MPEWVIELVYLFFPWAILLVVLFVFGLIFNWAKKKKTGAILFGALIQMFMPDPYVERTITVVQQEKKQQKKSEENGEKLLNKS